MERFAIRDIEHMTGIKAHKLRIWEQQYNLFTPKRKENKHRYYDNDDLKRILQIAFLYHSGWKISRIARLTHDEIVEVIVRTEINSINYKVTVIKLLEAAVDLNERAFVQILNELIDKVGLETCITQVCYPFLQRVGHLWKTNKIIPAQEHFSSYLIQHKIIAETDKLPEVAVNVPGVLLFTPDGEFHELPLLFINYLLKKCNWRTIYLGSKVKLQDLKKFEADKNISYLFLHVNTNLSGWEIDNYLENLCAAFPEIKIVAAGSGIQQIQRSFLNLLPLKSDEAIYCFIMRKPIPLATHSS
jgi:MerR family transcriptional regulator, light-induced transcriptional regulator